MTALDTAGSTLFKLTWRRRRTPLGRSYLERAVSVGQTSGSGFTSWPTPDTGMNVSDGTFEERRVKAAANHGNNGFGLTTAQAATLASWATPRTEDAESSGMRVARGVADTLTAQSSLAGWSTPNQRDYKSASASPEFLEIQQAETRGHNLSVEATLAGWSTPTCPAPHDSEQTVGKARPRDGYGQDIAIQASLAGWPTPMAGNPGTESYNEAGNTDSSRKTVELADWTTPQAHDATGRSKTQKEIHGTKHGCACLVRDSDLAGWPTPTREDAKRDDWTDNALIEATKNGQAPPQSSQRLRSFVQLAGPARLKASGEIVTGFTADPSEGIPMDAGGQLRAGHSRWLMAIPAAWDGFACTAMQSMSKSPRRGSKRTPKA